MERCCRSHPSGRRREGRRGPVPAWQESRGMRKCGPELHMKGRSAAILPHRLHELLLRMRSSVELEEKWGLGYVKHREQERAAAAQRALGPDPAGYPSRAAGTD